MTFHASDKLRVDRYGFTRFWAVWDGEDLVCLCVYKRGAVNVIKRLRALAAAPPPRAAPPL